MKGGNMTETTTITIDNIVKLIEGIAQSEYQRGYANGLEEKRLTEKHWGRVDESVDKAVDKAVDEKSCDTCVHWNKQYECCEFPLLCRDYQHYKTTEDKTE